MGVLRGSEIAVNSSSSEVVLMHQSRNLALLSGSDSLVVLARTAAKLNYDTHLGDDSSTLHRLHRTLFIKHMGLSSHRPPMD